MLEHLRVLEPHPNVLAFYDGRVPGYRFAQGRNWVDDGALSLGIASYAVVDGGEAVVYDTHVSLSHAAFIRRTLEDRGVRRFTVVLSHWHLDHIAGNAVFADCEIIASGRTAAHLARHRAAIEAGTYDGPPAIAPLVMPTRTFEERLSMVVGNIATELIAFDIHSDDGVVLWLPKDRLLLAGDTLEDTVTYVAEPDSLARHLPELERLADLRADRILPNHGCADRIASGGYGPELTFATRRYVRMLLAMPADAQLRAMPLRDLIAADLEAGTLVYLPDYESVHAGNVAAIMATAARKT
jgi:glyoxylase-like metal-dependent hydrolase (beta-lactamase superfamily II)